MLRPHFLDFSWQRPSAAQLAAADRDARTYNGQVLPPRVWFDECDRAGVGVCLIFETTSEYAQQGYDAGRYAAQFSMERAAGVGRPRIHTVFVVADGNSQSPAGNQRVAEFGQAVGDYYDGTYEFYGNRSCVEWACAGARASHGAARLVAGPRRDGGWLPVTWGFDPARDTASQDANTAPPIDGTDENTLYFGYEEDDVALTDEEHAWLRDLHGAVKALNFGDNRGDPGSMQDQAGRTAFVLGVADSDPIDVAHVLDSPLAQAIIAALRQPGAVDVDAVVSQVLDAYDHATNVNERATIEQAIRTALA